MSAVFPKYSMKLDHLYGENQFSHQMPLGLTQKVAEGFMAGRSWQVPTAASRGRGGIAADWRLAY